MLWFLLYFLLCLDVLLTCRVLVQIPSVILFDSFCHFDEFIGLLVSLYVFRIIYYLEYILEFVVLFPNIAYIMGSKH